MTHRCIDETQLDRLLELAEDHPDRQEVNSCVRCRTLLMQYAAFKSGHVPDESRYQEAEPALKRFVESSLSHPADSARKKQVRSAPLTFKSLFRGSNARFAWAAAAVAVVVFVAVITWAPWGGREIALRSESPPSQKRIELPELLLDKEGSVTMSWPRVRAADAYRVTVHTTEFEQIVSETTADTFYVLKRADLPGDAGSGDIVQWRIEALRMGEVVERSELGIIRFR